MESFVLPILEMTVEETVGNFLFLLTTVGEMFLADAPLLLLATGADAPLLFLAAGSSSLVSSSLNLWYM